MRAHATALILVGSMICPCFRLAATPVQLPVQIEDQYAFSWCWAASSLALLNRYDIYPGVTVETGTGDRGQCLIEQKLPAHAAYDCCDSPEDCDSPAEAEDVEDILENDYSLGMTVDESTITKTALINLVAAGKPVLITRHDGTSGHVFVVIGYNDAGDYFQILEVLWGFIREMSYTLLEYEEIEDPPQIWEWKKTLYPTNTPPDDVTLRYSQTDSAYAWTYSAPGNLVAGPDYVVNASSLQTTFKCGSDDTISMEPGFHVENGAKFQAIPQS